MICTIALIFALGMELDIANIMIASVILGIAVDDTAHFLHKLKTSCWKEDLKSAMMKAYEKTGGAIFFATVILSCGFLVFSFSGFIPMRNFGLLSSFAIVTALVGDLLVLPALLFIFCDSGSRFNQGSGLKG